MIIDLSANPRVSGLSAPCWSRYWKIARLIFLLVLGSALGASAAADRDGNPFDTVSRIPGGGPEEVWLIMRPNVQQETTKYPQIIFRPGDTFTVFAGGGVQTGGKGKSWKLYVNPSGPRSDKYYHGLIQIPGVTDKPTRFSDFGNDKQHKATVAAMLTLGYDDDHYSDNGYYAHDDGDDDQCRHVGPAFVIVCIRHDGQPATAASTFASFASLGITPETFRSTAAWAFPNFDTTDLPLSTYLDAFHLNKAHLVFDPLVWITFAALRGHLADGGNCVGMCLLAEIGEDQLKVGNLEEPFFQTQPTRTGPVTHAINTAHWKQASVFYLKHYLDSIVQSPEQVCGEIEQDLTKSDFNYGLLCLQHGATGGHCLVPLKVSRDGTKITVDVYDCYLPAQPGDPQDKPSQVVVDRGNWTFTTHNGNTWNGPKGLTGSGFGYIPYRSSKGWSDLVSDGFEALEVVFCGDAEVQQVTDGAGRNLYLPGQPGTVDTSSKGFGPKLVPWPKFDGPGPARPRSGEAMPYAETEVVPRETQEGVKEAQEKYGLDDYNVHSQKFIVTGLDLKDLAFTLATHTPGKPLRAFVHHSSQFYEVKSSSPAAALATFAVRDVGHLEAGVTIQGQHGTPLRTVFTHGLRSSAEHTMTVQETEEIDTAAQVAAQVSVNPAKELQVTAAGAVRPAKINRRVIDAAGLVR